MAYTGSTAAILSNYDEVLKTFYLPAVQEQLNHGTILADLIDTNEEDVSGKNATIEHHYGRTKGLGEDKLIARPGTLIVEHLFGMNGARYRKPILELIILNAVATHEKHFCLSHLIQATPEHLLEYGDIHLFDGETDDIHGCDRCAAHGVDI